jgi:hypothetical protein
MRIVLVVDDLLHAFLEQVRAIPALRDGMNHVRRVTTSRPALPAPEARPVTTSAMSVSRVESFLVLAEA